MKAAIQYLAAKPHQQLWQHSIPASLEYKYATHKTFYSTQINTQYDLFIECQYPQYNSTECPTALRQYLSGYFSSYLSSTICSTPALTAPNIHLPNSFTQYPCVAMH